jgi:hypothetical protein
LGGQNTVWLLLSTGKTVLSTSVFIALKCLLCFAAVDGGVCCVHYRPRLHDDVSSCMLKLSLFQPCKGCRFVLSLTQAMLGAINEAWAAAAKLPVRIFK